MTRTNAGLDWQAGIMGNATAAPANYIALSASTAAPDPSHTTLDGELTGSLSRAIATYAHTSGTSTYTLSKTFVSDQTVTLTKIGVFNASSGGTMFTETQLSHTVSLVSGDSVLIQETVTL